MPPTHCGYWYVSEYLFISPFYLMNNLFIFLVYKQNNPHEFELVLSPNFGSHFVEYQGKWVLYTREQDAAVDIALGIFNNNFLTINSFNDKCFFQYV